MEKRYPIDIAGIKKIGIEKWFNHYYVPVTGKEYYGIYSKVCSIYFSLLNNNNEILYSIGIANTTIITLVSRYLLDLLTLSRLKTDGYEYIVGKERVEVQEYISMCNFPSLSSMKQLVGEHLNGLNYHERIKNTLRVLKYNCELPHLMGKKLLNSISNPHFLIGNRDQHEAVAFCKENSISPIHLHPLMFAKKNTRLVDGFQQLPELEEFVNKLLCEIKESYSFVNKTAFERLKVHVVDYFSNSMILFCQNLAFMRKFDLRPLLAIGLSNTIDRIFCSAWRYAGGRVIGFSHGDSYSHCYSHRNFIVASLVEQYIVTSKGQEEIINQAAKDFMPDYRMPNIVHLKNNIYKPLFGKLQSNPPVNKIKEIMVVGTVVKTYSVIDTEYHTFSFLYNDIQLIKTLKKAGYYVTYKPRPDTMHETYDIFEKYADGVLNGKFEDVYKDSDCLLISTPYSSAFGFSLLTNKPIVLINVEGYTWYPRAFELIKKRCSVVDAKPVNGKIVFDEKELLGAIEDSLGNINYDLLYEFAF